MCLVSFSLLTEATTPADTVWSFGSGCLYWQNQQGIGHCVGGGGWVCLVRNWFSLELRQGWKVVALEMTPSPNETPNLFVHLCPDNGVSCCLSRHVYVCWMRVNVLSARVWGWSRDEVRLIRPRLKHRRRREVIPKGVKRSIRKDTPLPPPAPPCPSPATHFYADTHSSTYCSTLRHTHETNPTNTQVSTPLTAPHLRFLRIDTW